MGYYAPRISCTANTTGVASAVAANYATTRNATPATTTPGGATTGSIGQTNSAGNSICTELFLTFDTSAVPTGLAGFTTGYLTLNVTTVANASASTDYLEIYQVSSSANSIGGDTLATMTPLGSMPQPTAVGQYIIPFDPTNMTRSSTCILCIASRRQRLATAPVTSETGAIFTSMLGVAASRPFIDIAGPWILRNIGTVVESVTGTATLTLTEPGGCGAGDLIIAVIGMRSTATAAGSISLPAGWTRLAESYTNNTVTTSGAQPSGTVAYIIRGSSAPSYAFPYAVGNSVIQGQCVAYWAPSGNTVTPDVVGAVTFAAGSVVVNATGITTLSDDALLLHALIGGQEAVMTVFNATSPNADSGAATNTTQSPTAAWRRRFNSVTSSGADMGVSLADAVKPTAGATGNWTATASIAANHLSFPISFKMLGAGAVSVNVTGAGLTATAGTAGGAGPTTFNPLDKKDSNVALSNGNLTVTGNGSANNWARSVRPRSGKRYVEFTITTVANTIVGISGGGAITYPGDSADSFGMFSNGSGSIAGAFPFWGPAYTTGDVVGMAVDFTAKLVWYRKNGGAWNGTSGDPTAGTGGNDISAYTGTTHYVVASEDSTGVLIGNFGATAFQTAAPTGYLAWDGTPFVSPGVTSTALAISPGTVTVNAAKAVSPGVTSTQLGITAGTVTVTIGTAVSTTVTSTALATTAGSVTVTTTGGGTVTGQHIHPDGPYTGSENNDGGVDLNLGFAFCAFAPITITAIRFWKTSIDANTSRNVAIFNASGTSVASGTSSGEAVGVAQWITVPISPPLVMTGAGLSASYTAAAQFPGQHYSATANYYDIGKYSADGKAYALADSESLANTGTGNGCFEYGNNVLTKPGGTFNKGDYWIDVEYSYSTGGGTNVSANVTGDIVTTTAGTVSVTAKQFVSTNVTSTALGITAGTVTVNAKASTNVTGDIVTTSAGTVTVTAKQAPSVNVTGDIVTTTAGTVTVSAKQFVSTTVTGQALATTAGTVTVTTKQAPSVGVTGDVVTASAGSVSVAAGGSISAVAPGGVATTSAGTVTVNAVVAVANVSVPVTGSIATTSAGTVSVTALSPVLVTVTGQSVTASAGSVSVTGKANVTVTGSVATTSAGSVTALMTTNAPVTGQAISTSAGTVTVFGKVNVSILGEQLTISDGAVDAALSITVPVTGRTANTSVGSVVVAGDANVEVTDLQIKVRVGVPTFTFDYQLAITGVQATVRVGFAQSPNWGTVPDDKPENWSPLTAGTREEWTPVDHVKNDWTPVPTTTPQEWTEADHPKSDWTRI